MIELRNESGLEFKDISSESFRKYVLPNREEIYVTQPLFLNVSPSGGHRILDGQGFCWYIQLKESWYIRWQAKDGAPHFVK